MHQALLALYYTAYGGVIADGVQLGTEPFKFVAHRKPLHKAHLSKRNIIIHF